MLITQLLSIRENKAEPSILCSEDAKAILTNVRIQWIFAATPLMLIALFLPITADRAEPTVLCYETVPTMFTRGTYSMDYGCIASHD